MEFKNSIFRLDGVVQHYAWGGNRFIPHLLNMPNEESKPFAEYWMGAHDNAPAVTDENIPLNQIIQANPSILGENVKNRFGRLPFLFKILDVKEMLSIQLHPNKRDAEKEFAREQSLGIPLTAANRNYKDDNHKPELMMALSDFWLLHGFREPNSLIKLLSETSELQFLLTVFQKNEYSSLYERVMNMPQEEVNKILQPLLSRIVLLYEQGKLTKDNPDFWAARAALTYNRNMDVDRGVFSVYLLNLVYLKKGEAIFQDAGILHAYLEGQNAEIMANSDNVLRGGLTPKHVDVKELMKHVIFKPVIPAVIHGTPVSDVEQVFITPAPDFELSVIQLKQGQTCKINARTSDIFLVYDGSAAVSSDEWSLTLRQGDVMGAVSRAALQFDTKKGAEIFRASVSGYC